VPTTGRGLIGDVVVPDRGFDRLDQISRERTDRRCKNQGMNEFVRPGDRIFVQCEGGPCLSRLERFPPQLEIAERGGTYVLLDEGQPSDWRYLFVPDVR
jgi:hypothetical protein